MSLLVKAATFIIYIVLFGSLGYYQAESLADVLHRLEVVEPSSIHIPYYPPPD